MSTPKHYNDWHPSLFGALLVAISALCCNPLWAEATTEEITAQSTESEQAQMWGLVNDLTEDFFTLDQTVTTLSPLALLAAECDHLETASATAAALNAEAASYTDDPGLTFNGVYSDSAANDDDEGSAYVELAWDLLANGRRENIDRGKLFKQQADLADLAHQQRLFALTTRCRSQNLRRAELGQYAALLRLHAQLLEPAEWLERRAYFSGHALLDELLDAQGQLAVTTLELKKLHSNPQLDPHITRNSRLPVVDINIDALIASIREDHRPLRERELRRGAFHLNDAANRETRLRFYLRQQIELADQAGGLVAGVRFSIPVGRRFKAAQPQRMAEIDQQLDQQEWERIARTLTAYDEVSEQLSRVTTQHYRLLRSAERLRQVITARQQRPDAVRLATAATRLHTSLQAAEQLILAKQTLYERVNRVIRESQLAEATDHLHEVALPPLDYRARAGQRLLYIWASNFNDKDNDTLTGLIRAKGMQQVVISAGNRTNQNKLKQFITAATNADIKVELTFGDNQWIFPQNHEKALLKTLSYAALTERLHLDIEPQVLPGSTYNRAAYERYYLDLIRKIRTNLVDTHLSVAVPLHWRTETYAELAPLADELYVMAYEQKNSDQVIRRLQPILAVVPVQ